MKKIGLADCYNSLLEDGSFVASKLPEDFPQFGNYYELDPSLGKGYCWYYEVPNCFTVKVFDFAFFDDLFVESVLPDCLNIMLYESISGEEFNPYRRLNADTIRLYIGDNKPYKALIHRGIPICSIGLEVFAQYYKDYCNHVAFGNGQVFDMSQLSNLLCDFPAMGHLLREVKRYRGTEEESKAFYHEKVQQALSFIIEEKKHILNVHPTTLSDEDIEHLDNVIDYLNDHYAFEVSLEMLSYIACMGTTKLKTCFKQYKGCTVTEYIQQRRMSQAEHLLAHTDFSIAQIAEMVGYSTSSRFAELFRRSTGLLPMDYRKIGRGEDKL